MGIPYDSDKAVALGEAIMKFITDEGRIMSQELAKERGVFPNFKGSAYDRPGQAPVRNATVTTIAPTGTLSIIAGCSSGIEPMFALSFIRRVLDGAELVEVNPVFEKVAKEGGFFSDELMKEIAEHGGCAGIDSVPKNVQEIFVTARAFACTHSLWEKRPEQSEPSPQELDQKNTGSETWPAPVASTNSGLSQLSQYGFAE